MIHWKLAQDIQPLEQDAFETLDKVFSLPGKLITSDNISCVVKVEVNDVCYYVKRYTGAAKNPMRRWVGRPRVQKEWENLQQFGQWGLATARLVAWGQEKSAGRFVRGALITEEVQGTDDLTNLAYNNDARLHDKRWIDAVAEQLAGAAQTMHQHRFAHNDLKWRNILVSRGAKPIVFLIDCPGGTFWRYPFLYSRIVKDIACLDKVARYYLSSSQRLRFFLRYRGHDRLTQADKKFIRSVLRYRGYNRRGAR